MGSRGVGVPTSTWESGTLNLREPRLATPGNLIKGIPRRPKIGVMRPMAPGVKAFKTKSVPLKSLLGSRRMKF